MGGGIVKRLLTGFFSAVLVAMLWVTIRATLDRGVFEALGELWGDLWFRATLFDAYFAFLTVFVWIAWREDGWLRRAVWLVLLLSLGNIAIASYFLWALARLRPGASWDGLFRKSSSAGLDP